LRRIGVGYTQVLNLGLFALKDQSRDVRAQAAWLLGNFQDTKSIRPLIRAMSDPHWSVRESIEITLLNFGGKAVPDLIEVLKSRSWTTRFRAARILGEVGDERAIEPIEALLAKKGERRKVKQVAEEALRKLKGKLAA
jgi:HEAT repeat protein